MSNSWQRSWSIQGPKRLLQMSTFEISQLTYIFKIIMLLVIFFLLYSWVIIYRGVICCDHSFTSLKISSGLCGTVGKRTGRRISRMLSSFSPFKYKHHILFMFRKTLISLSLSLFVRERLLKESVHLLLYYIFVLKHFNNSTYLRADLT